MHALLVTRDDRVITEFQKIAAVTQSPLVIESEPNADDLSNAYRVFVASDCTADASAMAGALELEFNQGQACETARNFKMNFPSSTMSCQASESLIKVELKLPNTYFPTRFLLPNLVASATAGIAQPIEPMP